MIPGILHKLLRSLSLLIDISSFLSFLSLPLGWMGRDRGRGGEERKGRKATLLWPLKKSLSPKITGMFLNNCNPGISTALTNRQEGPLPFVCTLERLYWIFLSSPNPTLLPAPINAWKTGCPELFWFWNLILRIIVNFLITLKIETSFYFADFIVHHCISYFPSELFFSSLFLYIPLNGVYVHI